MTLKKILTIGFVAAVLVACGDDSSSATDSDEVSSSSVCEDCDDSSSSKAKSSSSSSVFESETKQSSDSKSSSSSVKSSSSSAKSSSSKENDTNSSSSAVNSSSSETGESSSSVPEGYVDPSTVVKGTMTDERDGQIYKTVKIGTQTWMAENLNYAYTGVPYDKDNYTSDSISWCYGHNPDNCTEYGRLYTWAAAMDSVGTWTTNGKGCGFRNECSQTYPVRGVCPEGWHLTAKKEFMTLLTAVGGNSRFDNFYNGANLDEYSFAVLFAGGFRDGQCYDVRKNAYFWSSSQVDSDVAYYMFSRNGNEEVQLITFSKHIGMSVRCVKDE